MITIPLAPVVSHFTRKGADLACLEGSPRVTTDGDLAVCTAEFLARWATMLDDMPAEWGLYLGSGPVCPAAMGWAAAVLAAGYPTADPRIDVADRHVVLAPLYGDPDDGGHIWRWGMRFRRVDDPWTNMMGDTPPTPAARLKAVLEYEMGRV